MKKITDPTFKYVHSSKTDISVRFRAERKRLAKLEELKQKFNTVTPFRKEGSK